MNMSLQSIGIYSDLAMDLNDIDYDENKTVVVKRPTIKIHDSWKDEIANAFNSGGWELRSFYKYNPRPRRIDIFAYDQNNWLAVVIKSNKFNPSERNLKKAFRQTRYERFNHKVLIFSGSITERQLEKAKKMNVLVIPKTQIGLIRERLVNFKRDYPDSHQ